MSFRHKQDKENMITEDITEDYVGFKVAKLLKEKGFDGLCYKVWESYGNSQTLVGASWFVEGETVVNRESVDAAAKQYAYEYNLNNNVEGYLAPTHQMARKWLRRKYGLFIRITEDMTGNVYEWSVYQKNYGCRASTYVEDSYEQAEETAIKYCLENLI